MSAAVRVRLAELLDRIESVPSAKELEPAHGDWLSVLQTWQLERLRCCYRDLDQQARYHQATHFFVEELYGPQDRTARYRSLRRILPMMERVLPRRALDTLALALELQALSDELDLSLASSLQSEFVDDVRIDQRRYAAGYRRQDRFESRWRQLELLDHCGRELERVVGLPMVLLALRLARGPAELAGLSDLHGFLENGCRSFAAMRGADHFLATITERERRILERIQGGAERPFPPDWVPVDPLAK